MNSELYDKNIKALENRWPELRKQFEKSTGSSDISCEVTEIDGCLVPLVHKGDRTYQLSSIYSDSVMLDRWSDFVDVNMYEAVVYMFGLGTGCFLRRFLEKAGSAEVKKTSVFVYEPDTVILKELFGYYDYSDIFADKKVTIGIGTIDDGPLKDWTSSTITYSNIHGTGSSYYPNYPRIFPEIRKKYDQELEEMFSDYYANISFRYHTHTLFSNTLANINRMVDSLSLSSLADLYSEDIPAFVVSSGPSLSKNIQELKSVKGKGLIIAADSALGVFDRAGIIPDIYVSVDPGKQKENFKYEWVRKIPALIGITSPKHVVSEGQPYFMMSLYDEYTGWFIASHCNGKPHQLIVQGGGSVATYAFSLGHVLGAKRIIFVGQDLAYTGDAAHAVGVAVDDDEMLSSVDTIDIYGNPVRTSRELVWYRRWFENVIEKSEELEVIDATEGGALIKGTKIMTLKEAVDKYCVKDWDIEGMLQSSGDLFSGEEKKEYLELMYSVPEKMDEIIRDSRKLISDYEKLETYVRKGGTSGDKLKKQLSKTTKLSDRIEENRAFSYIDMVNSVSEVDVERRVNSVNPDAERDLINLCVLGREHSENIIKSAEQVKKDFIAWKTGKTDETSVLAVE